jgi:hypothetical protein
MAEWVSIGDSVVNIDTIEYVTRTDTGLITVYLSSGRELEITNQVAEAVWTYLDSVRLKFLDMDNPTRNF